MTNELPLWPYSGVGMEVVVMGLLAEWYVYALRGLGLGFMVLEELEKPAKDKGVR